MSESNSETNDLVKFLTEQMRHEREEKRTLQKLVAELIDERDKLKDEIRYLRITHRI